MLECKNNYFSVVGRKPYFYLAPSAMLLFFILWLKVKSGRGFCLFVRFAKQTERLPLKQSYKVSVNKRRVLSIV